MELRFVLKGLWLWKYVEFILHGMKLRESCLRDGCLRMVRYEWWPYNVADVYDFCIWSMRACEFNNDE